MLLLLALFGGVTLAASTHFASFFLGLEILSVSLYALIAYPRQRAEFVEAGVKYLILGGVDRRRAALRHGAGLRRAAAR